MRRITPQEHLDNAANNLGYDDFSHMMMCEENSVIEPIVLSRMYEHAKQLAQEVIKSLKEQKLKIDDEDKFGEGMWAAIEMSIEKIKQTFDL